MAVTVTVPGALRQYVNGQSRVSVTATSVAGLISALTTDYPALGRQLLNERGELRSFVNLYVGDEDIRFLDGVATALRDGETVSIVPAIAGGAD